MPPPLSGEASRCGGVRADEGIGPYIVRWKIDRKGRTESSAPTGAAENDRTGESEGPGAVAEEVNGPAVFAERVDGKVGCADHEVLVDHGVVHAERAALVERLMLKVADGVGKAVPCGILWSC